MKFLRILFSFLTGLLTSIFLAVTFFHYSSFSSPIDRLFLILVPTLAIGIFFHQAFPHLSAWTRNPQIQFTIPYYLLSFLLTLNLTYGAVGFMRDVLRTPFGMFLFTAVCMTIGTTIGYFLIQHATRSFRDGFLGKPLNFILALSLPVLWIALIISTSQFPSMSVVDYFRIYREWMPLFLLTVLASALPSFIIITRHSPVITSHFSLPSFIQHLPGLYAAGMVFLIELVISRSLNHPALDHNTVLFESDAGPWMTILASPESAVLNRSVHPLSLILIRPLVRFVSGMMGEHYALGGMLVVSAVAAACVFMTWFFVKRATDSKTHAFLFAILLGSTATYLLFGSLVENYIFGAASLIFFFLLLQAKETRFSLLIPAGLLLFGITITNIAQGIIALFFNKFGLKRLIQYIFCILALGVLFTLITNIIYPKHITFFFVPEDIAYEFSFVSPESEGVLSDPIRLSEPSSVIRKFNVVSRSILLYGIVAPDVIESVSEKPPFPTIDLKTFDVRERTLASYRGFSNLPLAIWLVLLLCAFMMFIKNVHTSKHTPLMLGLLGALGFNFLMHLFYGTELFLYTSYWVYALVLFAALAYSDLAEKAWMQWGLSVFVLLIMVNNFFFVSSIFRALAPFYSASP
ncbi:MAG: hypothetical protein JETCAE01_12460 [Anaerolineaceae bacterium]|nr:MAG: hypothetical protein JETCAE01_12460 [Anaerolineaceae bacterium]